MLKHSFRRFLGKRCKLCVFTKYLHQKIKSEITVFYSVIVNWSKSKFLRPLLWRKNQVKQFAMIFYLFLSNFKTVSFSLFWLIEQTCISGQTLPCGTNCNKFLMTYFFLFFLSTSVNIIPVLYLFSFSWSMFTSFWFTSIFWC